jgi:branched-chain amino acid transport system ATP-binding protein
MKVPLLRTVGLTKEFGGLRAIDDLEFQVDEGEIVSVIGPNGAGKTTFFNLITGLVPTDRGDIIFDGHNLAGLRPNEITSYGIARTFQTVRLFNNMTILENAMVAQHTRSHAKLLGTIFQSRSYREQEERIRENAEKALAFFGTRLSGYRHDQMASVLSYANRRRLEIARAMATEARLLLLDEPTAGMNPRETLEMTELIGRLRGERGYTIIVIEHDMKVVKGVSDRVVVLDYGSKIAEGDYAVVSQDQRVLEAYLGSVGDMER